MRKLAHWCVQHRRIVVAIWVVTLVALSAIGGSVGTAYKDSFKLSGTDSFDAINLLKRAAPKESGDREQVVFAVKQGSVRDAASKMRRTGMPQPPPDRWCTIIRPSEPRGNATQ